MKEERPPKPDDQDNIEKAYQIIRTALEESKIEPTLCAGATFTILAEGYRNSGFSYKEFCEELDEVKDLFKLGWDE